MSLATAHISLAQIVQYLLDLQAEMNNPVASSNKMMTRLGLKRWREFEYRGDENSSKKQKRIEEMRKTGEEEIKGEEKLGEKIISDQSQKEWTRKTETADIKSKEGKIESKGVR